jgi:peptidoglycan/LPS O-acetylase OafA/YrhL
MLMVDDGSTEGSVGSHFPYLHAFGMAPDPLAVISSVWVFVFRVANHFLSANGSGLLASLIVIAATGCLSIGYYYVVDHPSMALADRFSRFIVGRSFGRSSVVDSG